MLTDCEEAVLLNLRECVAANASADRSLNGRHALSQAAGAPFSSQVHLFLTSAVRPFQAGSIPCIHVSLQGDCKEPLPSSNKVQSLWV